jgi:hypothetical protein
MIVMSEMVERVARALCREIGIPEDALTTDRNDVDLERAIPCWQHQLPKARAAIAAMREPTIEMLNAGLVGDKSLAERWGAMIDECSK